MELSFKKAAVCVIGFCATASVVLQWEDMQVILGGVRGGRLRGAALIQPGSDPLKEGNATAGDAAVPVDEMEDLKWAAAAAEVVEATRFTWQKYEEKAWGEDTIHPLSGRTSNWCKMGVMITDSLSTLWLMGLKDEFERARKYMEEKHMPTAGSHGRHSTFETTIRVLAGIISAYELSGEKSFLDIAVRLGDNMVHVFDTESGVPQGEVDVGTGDTSHSSRTSVAEAGTLGLEFRQLSHISGDRKYQVAADRAQAAILKAAHGRGLVPNDLSMSGAEARFVGGEYSLGARGDSYYEYLLKQWLQGGSTETHLKDAWIQTVKDMMERMIQTTGDGLKYVDDLAGSSPRNRFQHLTCFVPGMLMLGSRRLPKSDVNPEWEPLAESLVETCYQMYMRQPSGLSPEYVDFRGRDHSEMRVGSAAPHNMLRPETAESIYYMWYFTGKEKYRQMNLKIFEAFQKHSKAAYGYATYRDVSRNGGGLKDEQESFWVAETLKYLYLTFAPRETLNLETHVFNTEAHPFKLWHPPTSP